MDGKSCPTTADDDDVFYSPQDPRYSCSSEGSCQRQQIKSDSSPNHSPALHRPLQGRLSDSEVTRKKQYNHDGNMNGQSPKIPIRRTKSNSKDDYQANLDHNILSKDMYIDDKISNMEGKSVSANIKHLEDI